MNKILFDTLQAKRTRLSAADRAYLRGQGIAEEEEQGLDLKKIMGMKYDDFATKLKDSASDPRVVAAVTAGMQDGKVSDDMGVAKDIVVKVADLRPTQNEVDVDKSLAWPLKSAATAAMALEGSGVTINGPIVTFMGKYVIDGHHRWSQVYAINPDATMKALDLVLDVKDPIVVLKAVQMAILAKIGRLPTAQVKGRNLLKSSEKEIVDYVVENLKEELIPTYQAAGAGSTREEIAAYIWNNVKVMQKKSQPVAGAPGRNVMPQTDEAPGWEANLKAGGVNWSKPFVKEHLTVVNDTLCEVENRLLRQILDKERDGGSQA